MKKRRRQARISGIIGSFGTIVKLFSNCQWVEVDLAVLKFTGCTDCAGLTALETGSSGRFGAIAFHGDRPAADL
jgi:hypothetical protein